MMKFKYLTMQMTPKKYFIQYVKTMMFGKQILVCVLFTELNIHYFYYMLYTELLRCFSSLVITHQCTNATLQKLVLIKHTHPCIPQMQLQKLMKNVRLSKTGTRETRCQ